MKLTKEHKTFGGKTSFWNHDSKITKTSMNFATFIPASKKVDSCIVWLSGLTCNEENFITKSGVQKYLKDSNTMIICPDTSPRGLDLPGEHDNYDFGSGAGFYVNATTKNYKDHYLMFDYICKELHNIIINKFLTCAGKISIMGHSMGGHGALVIGLNNADQYHAISAFAPITNSINCGWGKRALIGYLGNDENLWKKYDACELIKSGKKHSKAILIDQGSEDEFLEKNLLTQNFIDICKENNQELKASFRPGYDHSYYFVSSFIESHINFHLRHFIS